jgi:hypothetical protein
MGFHLRFYNLGITIHIVQQEVGLGGLLFSAK